MRDSDGDSKLYQRWEGTPEWGVLDRALKQLVANRELQESSRHEYLVGFLCKALGEVLGEAPERTNRSGEDDPLAARRRASQEDLRRAQEMIAPSPPSARSVVDKLIGERRAEALRE